MFYKFPQCKNLRYLDVELANKYLEKEEIQFIGDRLGEYSELLGLKIKISVLNYEEENYLYNPIGNLKKLRELDIFI